MEVKMLKKLTAILLISAMVLSGLFAAGAKEEAAPSGPVSIKIATWTSNQSQLDLLGSFVKEFAEKEGIEIDVTFESIAFAEYNTKLSLDRRASCRERV